MDLLTIPKEILFHILGFLDHHDILTVLSLSSSLTHLYNDEDFWHALVLTHNITYRIDNTTWRDLYTSNETLKMCPHLQLSHRDNLQRQPKRQWDEDTDRLLCLEPSCCSELGNAAESSYYSNRNHDALHHRIALKLDQCQFLTVWCSACQTCLGKTKTEQYLVHQIIQSLPFLDDPTFVRRRKEFEIRLLMANGTYIIDRAWFLAWTAYLRDANNEYPGVLDNSKLYREDGRLRSDIKLGEHFELIGQQALSYIIRVYRLVGNDPVSSLELQHQAEYCQVYHSLLLRQQMLYHRRYRGHPILVLSE
ncbi:uncharacterized protein BYT42DRAFT_647688 [Radiomyces spectabilis]|uniref:uncharacterized protein n=1 Tax=Radiomyces spectabilis TaxID=64574 RepID=UPI00221E9022|nr:uncharacterized protein BYT42DRAFT_647688 [Radiomyces spectabilis]KAI8370438.1 hypothetical protein BYT42DRAFT_647688 [Radiomyces spectabilis]